MSRSAEFGLGATYKQKDAEGNETTRSAIEAVGGAPERWAGPSEADWQREERWSRGH